MNTDLSNFSFDQWLAEILRIIVWPLSGESVASNIVLGLVIAFLVCYVALLFSHVGQGDYDAPFDFE